MANPPGAHDEEAHVVTREGFHPLFGQEALSNDPVVGNRAHLEGAKPPTQSPGDADLSAYLNQVDWSSTHNQDSPQRLDRFAADTPPRTNQGRATSQPPVNVDDTPDSRLETVEDRHPIRQVRAASQPTDDSKDKLIKSLEARLQDKETIQRLQAEIRQLRTELSLLNDRNNCVSLDGGQSRQPGLPSVVGSTVARPRPPVASAANTTANHMVSDPSSQHETEIVYGISVHLLIGTNKSKSGSTTIITEYYRLWKVSRDAKCSENDSPGSRMKRFKAFLKTKGEVLIDDETNRVVNVRFQYVEKGVTKYQDVNIEDIEHNILLKLDPNKVKGFIPMNSYKIAAKTNGKQTKEEKFVEATIHAFDMDISDSRKKNINNKVETLKKDDSDDPSPGDPKDKDKADDPDPKRKGHDNTDPENKDEDENPPSSKRQRGKQASNGGSEENGGSVPQGNLHAQASSESAEWSDESSSMSETSLDSELSEDDDDDDDDGLEGSEVSELTNPEMSISESSSHASSSSGASSMDQDSLERDSPVKVDKDTKVLSVANGTIPHLDPTSSTLQQQMENLEEDPFTWLDQSFGNWPRRNNMTKTLDEVAISNAIANSVKHGLKKKVSESISDYDFHSFYPRVVISYSTGNRRDKDVPCAGPGLLVATGVTNHLLNHGYPCYIDMLTPAGRDWREFMTRLEKASVLIVLMTRTFFRSVHCLREVSAAIKNGVEIMPVRCEEWSVDDKDISRDRDEIWSLDELDELAKYSEHQHNKMFVLDDLNVQRATVEILSTISSIPAHGTLLGEETALGELVSRIEVLLSDETRLKQKYNPTTPVVTLADLKQLKDSANVLSCGTNLPISIFPECPPLYGRKEEMTQLYQTLDSGRRMAALVGGAGMGKTHCASHHAHAWVSQDSMNRLVLWLEAETENGVRESYLNALEALGGELPDTGEEMGVSEIAGLVWEKIKILPTQFEWMVVYNNVPEVLGDLEGPEAFSRLFFPTPLRNWGRGRILLTTRCTSYGGRMKSLGNHHVAKIVVDSVDESTAVNMLIDDEDCTSLSESEMVAAKELVKMFGYMALAIVTAKSQMVAESLSMFEYLEDLKNGLLESDVHDAVSLALRKLLEYARKHGLGRVLEVAAFLSPDQLTLELLDCDRATARRLCKLSLLRHVGGEVYGIHLLHQEAARDGCSPSAAMTVVANTLLSRFDANNSNTWKFGISMVPHLDSLEGHVEEMKKNGSLSSQFDDAAYACLLDSTALILHFALHNYSGARAKYEKSLQLKRQVYGPDAKNADLASTLGNLGNLESDVGHYEKAREYYEELSSTYIEFSCLLNALELRSFLPQVKHRPRLQNRFVEYMVRQYSAYKTLRRSRRFIGHENVRDSLFCSHLTPIAPKAHEFDVEALRDVLTSATRPHVRCHLIALLLQLQHEQQARKNVKNSNV